MRHVRVMTKPARAVDVDDLSKWVGFLTAALYFFTTLADTFGVQIPQKVNDDTEQ